MGSNPAQLQREIAEQRRVIERKLDTLQGRLREDMKSAREDVRGLKDRLPGNDGASPSGLQAFAEERPNDGTSPGRFSLDGVHVLGYDLGNLELDEQVSRRPLTSMAMAVGAGLVLGMMSGAEERREREYRRRYRGDGRPAGLFGPLMAALEDRTQDELGRFVNQAADRIKHGNPPGSEPQSSTTREQPGNGSKSPTNRVARSAPERAVN